MPLARARVLYYIYHVRCETGGVCPESSVLTNRYGIDNIRDFLQALLPILLTRTFEMLFCTPKTAILKVLQIADNEHISQYGNILKKRVHF